MEGPIAAHVEREVWVRAGMFGTIIILVVLILVTPNLLGHPSELSSVPVLLVAMTPDRSMLIVDVTGAVQAYLYDNVTMNVSRWNPNGTGTSLASYARNDTYNAALYLPAPANSTLLWIHVRLVDQQRNYFEYNVTMYTFNDTENGDRLTMVFNFPDVPTTTTQRVVPPSDFRWAVPHRGLVP